MALPESRPERELNWELVAGRGARGHIANLGHGVVPSTPIEGVAAFVEAVVESAPAA